MDAKKAKSSTWSKIQSAVSRLSEAQRKQLDKDPDGVIGSIEGVAKTLTDLLDEIEGLRSTGLAEFVARGETAMDDMEEVDVEGESELQAMQFLLSEKSKETKAEKNSARCVKTRLINNVVKGGFGKTFSKILARRFDKEEETPLDSETFDATVPTLFNDDDEAGKQMLKHVDEFQNRAVDLKGKVASLSDSLDKKPEWKGAMVRTPMDPHDFNGFYFKDKVFGNEDNGSTPWLATCRPHSWRYGPHAWPLPGFGAFVQALDPSENLESYIVAIPITGMWPPSSRPRRALVSLVPRRRS